MISLDVATPITVGRSNHESCLESEQQNNGYGNSNINYLIDENRYKISVKFFNSLPTMATIPPFNPTKVSEWSDKMKSFLRGCHSLDLMLRDDREKQPIRVMSESVEQYEKRLFIYNERSRALYLILDKSLSGNTVNLDPKFLALSEKLYAEDVSDIGYKLYEGIIFLLKGSHLWSRMDTINDLMKIKLERLGQEQSVFNEWKRQTELQSSLQMDLQKFQKVVLINALNNRKEHKTVVLQLAAMTPEELFNLSPQDILDRFLASAGHLQNGSKEVTETALYASSDQTTKRKLDSSVKVCYNCQQPGHFKAQCPKGRSNVKSNKFAKKFKKSNN